MFVLLAAVFGTATAMHDELGAGTLTRLLVAPVAFSRLVIGKVGVRFVVGCAQESPCSTGADCCCISLGSSATALIGLSAALAFAAAALGLLVGASAATREQTLPLSLATTLSLSALAGLWWPISVVPDWLQRVGQCFFPTWAMYGMTDVILRDRGLAAMAAPIAVMLVQGVLCLAVGLWLLRRLKPTFFANPSPSEAVCSAHDGAGPARGSGRPCAASRRATPRRCGSSARWRTGRHSCWSG
jgi:ABC-2 type transport system permease protein